MAKAIIRFKKNKVRVAPALSKRQKRLRWILAGLLILITANFGWDGYKRKEDLSKTYELSRQYYGIISTETENSFDRIKKQIDTLEKDKRK